MDLKALIRPGVRSQRAYPVEAIDCRIKLDANENPYPLSAALRERIQEALRAVPMNRYPEPGSPTLVKAFARHYGVDTAMVIAGNGSDEVIQILCEALAGSERGVLVPTPTFVMYRIMALNLGYLVTEVALDEQFDLDRAGFLRVLRETSPAITFLAYPNNPTGNCFAEETLRAVLDEATGIVVVDEAYGDFSGKTFLPLLSRHENLVILKTLSKVGFAAMRVGFLIGRPELVEELHKVRLPYNMNALSQAAALFFLEAREEIEGQVRTLRARRDLLFREMAALPGLFPYRTDANFIFFRCLFGADRLYRGLLERGILIKNFNTPGRLENCMRVTVGGEEENRAFVEALKDVISQ